MCLEPSWHWWGQSNQNSDVFLRTVGSENFGFFLWGMISYEHEHLTVKWERQKCLSPTLHHSDPGPERILVELWFLKWVLQTSNINITCNFLEMHILKSLSSSPWVRNLGWVGMASSMLTWQTQSLHSPLIHQVTWSNLMGEGVCCILSDRKNKGYEHYQGGDRSWICCFCFWNASLKNKVFVT